MLNLLLAAGVSAAVTLGTPIIPASTRWAGVTIDTTLAGRLAGTWTGHRSTPLAAGSWDFTMEWDRTPDGHLTGSLRPAGHRAYPITLVWADANRFIFVSAPHRDRALREMVVTRGKLTLTGNQLNGTVDVRPTMYEGKTLRGEIHATAASM